MYQIPVQQIPGGNRRNMGPIGGYYGPRASNNQESSQIFNDDEAIIEKAKM
jgi:hypothetical protein